MKLKVRALRFAFCTLLLASLFSCGEKDTHQTNLADCGKYNYEEDIKPLLTTYCTDIACHGANQLPILTYYDAVKATVDNGSLSRRVIVEKDMPPIQDLSNEEFDIINCWINAGAPETVADQ